MRYTVFIVLALMVAALAVCGKRAFRSDKSIGRSVGMLLFSLIPPIAGNLIIIASTAELPAHIGYYIYFIGMDFIMACLVKYTLDYCNFKWENKKVITAVYSLFTLDIIQLLLNPFLGHAFSLRKISVGGAPYYQLIPYFGQTLHRIVAYGFFTATLVLFMIKTVRTSRIYVEKYFVILFSMLFGGLWETFYIFSGTPIDTSMIGFGVFGFLVYYFSIYYKPRVLVDRMLAGIASDLPEALYFFDGERNCIWANQPALDLINSDGNNLEDVKARLVRMFPNVIDSKNDWRTDQTIGRGKDIRYFSLEKRSIIDKKGRFAGTFFSIRDNTETQKRLEIERYNARHDSLTGLYNKEFLFRQIRDVLRTHPGVPYLVAFVDVNEFKMVNDVFGKDFGDHVLITIGEWIAESMTKDCVYGRLGGDTFGVCQPVSMFNPVRINGTLSNFVVKKDNIEHHILMHVGVFEIDDPDLDPSIMFDRARMALTTIKRTYSHIAYYNDSLKDKMLWDQQISAQLDEAIAQRQIVPYLQPIVDAHGKVVGAEALARWIHPEKGFLSPADFIPLFEQNGKISEVDRYIWRCACELLKGWETLHPDFFLSVNISPIDFYFMDLRMELNHLAKDFGIDPGRLRLEITESVMMSNIEDRIATINGLRDDGFIIEMDDFGSGYSSLNLLKDLPVDLIKLDMMFLNKSKDNEKARIILDGVIKLVDSLNIVSLTEGVETEAQFRTLADMGCKLFQGFHFARPIPVDEFNEYCRKNADGTATA